MTQNLNPLNFTTSLLKQITLNPSKFGLFPSIFSIEESLFSLEATDLDPLIFQNSSIEKLQDALNLFFSEEASDTYQRIFYLVGPSGSGKSTSVQLFYINYLRKWKPENLIPLYLKASWRQDMHQRWAWLCKELELDENNFPLFYVFILKIIK